MYAFFIQWSPNIEAVSVCLSMSLPVCQFVRLPVCMSLCLSVCLSVSVSLSVSVCLCRVDELYAFFIQWSPNIEAVSVCLSMSLPFCQFVRLPVCMSLSVSVCVGWMSCMRSSSSGLLTSRLMRKVSWSSVKTCCPAELTPISLNLRSCVRPASARTGRCCSPFTAPILSSQVFQCYRAGFRVGPVGPPPIGGLPPIEFKLINCKK